jgi:hypothetical protein
MKHAELHAAILSTADKTGRVTPRGMVDAAKDDAHPLHGQFDWDDARVADQHRMAVARQLLTKVGYIGKDVRGRIVPTQYFVHEPGVEQQSYVPLSAVARDKKQSYALLLEEMARIESLIRRAQRIADVVNMRDDLDALLEAAVVTRAKAEQKKSGRRTRETRPSA